MTDKKLFYGILAIVVLSVVWIGLSMSSKSSVAPDSMVIITTDKTEYSQGETVRIAILNNFSYPVVPHGFLLDEAKTIRFMGENYGIAIIEKFEEGAWVEIEPVWRCGDSCFAECKYVALFEPAEKRVFEWNQTILFCDKANRTEKIEYAMPGKYRISSAVWLSEGQTYKLFYSNEFTVKSSTDCIKIAGMWSEYFENESAVEWCEECVNENGIPTFSPDSGPFCNLKTSDAGKACTDWSQCEGICVSENENSTSGKCSGVKYILGCGYVMEEGVSVEMCFD